MTFRLPRLPATEPSWSTMQIWWQQVVEAIEGQETTQDELLQALADSIAASAAATSAATAANAAAASAQTAAEDVTSAQALGTSYVGGATITATDAGANATVTITSHTRYYPQSDGSALELAVNGGAVTGLAYSTQYFVYYDDLNRLGGAVTYKATTDASLAAQLGDRHVVGSVTTPAALGSPTTGDYVAPPGAGAINTP